MPKTFRKAVEEGISREQFIEEQEEKAPRRRPRKKNQPMRGTLWAKRNKRMTIREAAERKAQVILTYKKITTGETKKYVVAPYSYRYRNTREGRRKMLFAYDMRDKHIKGFALRNIKNVALTDRKFKPKWPVEIG